VQLCPYILGNASVVVSFTQLAFAAFTSSVAHTSSTTSEVLLPPMTYIVVSVASAQNPFLAFHGGASAFVQVLVDVLFTGEMCYTSFTCALPS